MTNNSKILVVSLLLLAALITFTLFEFKDVSTAQWKRTFSYEDKEPMGLYVFKEIVMEHYSGIESSVEPFYKDSTDTKGLYIYASQYAPRYDYMDTLISFAEKGNDILLISSTYPSGLNQNSDFDAYDLSIYTDRLDFRSSIADSNSMYTYEFKNSNFETDSLSIQLFDNFDDSYSTKQYIKTVTSDGNALLIAHKFGTGSIYTHAVPTMFYNYSYQQSHMFDYTEEVLSHFDPAYVMLLKKVLPNQPATEKENPLQYIMSSPPLKAAYFTLLLGLLTYALIGGRRRQKSIQITEKNENTSLEYVDTVSQLFHQQESHEKLVAHMSEIFYHKMEKRFFIKKGADGYLTLLVKKSKIDYNELKFILDRFKNVEDGYAFQDDQLVNLNKRLALVYHTLENPNNAKVNK